MGQHVSDHRGGAVWNRIIYLVHGAVADPGLPGWPQQPDSWNLHAKCMTELVRPGIGSIAVVVPPIFPIDLQRQMSMEIRNTRRNPRPRVNH